MFFCPSRHLKKSHSVEKRQGFFSGSWTRSCRQHRLSCYCIQMCSCQAHHFFSFAPNKCLAHVLNIFVPAAAFDTLDTARFLFSFRAKQNTHVSLIYWHSSTMTTKKTFHFSESVDHIQTCSH